MLWYSQTVLAPPMVNRAWSADDTHRLSKCSEVSVECAVVTSHDDRFTRLISGDDQTDPELLKYFGQVRSMYAAQVSRIFRLGFALRHHCG